ncbi:Suppressor of profilin deletion [Wickerhamomyces ciferrii]|uniref:Suppressor of profilin deletion n=1 Tax=Wickerhamomyces ciferrii (strain ATCC 14091 / BCRC 22168 / CBS 111 / JCM 3599 / NBRC 0793 / NRRL Y-1031 F-60-10) TaxID=1206466 RepID=K0KBP1_WICCF|nr:Suppressor of profilin deletion [Wickerhamomyces ciferrii]CCH42470.1 Suppressor of profilin deletion [Wickerhamomyces ciferrii]
MASQERTQYSSSILVSQSPIDATEIVRVRLSQAKLLNDEFARFFKNYQSIKSNYLNQLNRLIKDSQDLNKNIERGIIENQVLSREELKYYNVDAIGHLGQIWGQVISEIKDEVATNYRLGQVIDRDVISPLSQYTSKDKRWGEIRGLHAKLSEVAQTIEFNQDKVEKYQHSKNPEKIAKYESALQSANQTWDSEAPFVFESFECTDFDRLSFLRDSLLRFQTAYSDALNKTSQSNEKALETILNFNPETEISRFAKVSSEASYIPKEARKAAESPKINQNESGTVAGSHSHGHVQGHGSQAGPPLGTGSAFGSSAGNRQASVSTTATTQTQNNNKKATRPETSSSSSKESKSKGKLKSKVGSIFGRKKNKNKNLDISDTVPESETSSLASAPRTNTNRLSRASSLASRLKTQPSGNNLAPQHQQDDISGGQQPKGGSSGVTAVGAGAGAAVAAGGAYVASHLSNEQHPQQQQQSQQQPKPISKNSGAGSYGQPQNQQSSSYPQQQRPLGQQQPLASQSTSSSDVPLSLNQPPLKPTSRANSSANVNGASPTISKPVETTQQTFNDRRPSERSYSDTNSSLNHDQHSHEALQHQPPPSQIQLQSSDSLTQDHRAPPPPPSRKTQQFGSQNLTNIREDGDTSFGSTQSGPAHHGSVPPPPAVAASSSTQGQRRDIQSGLFTNLNQTDIENHQNKRISSFNSFGGDSINNLNPQLTGSSLTLNHPGLFQHSALTQPGLNASVAEVINAKFKDGVQINSQIVGEIAFNYLSDGYDIPTRSNLKIHGSQQFDKIIPNNQFLKQIDHDEFEIIPHSILSRTLGGLKYLIKNSNAPIIVHPVWRFEPHQASVMLTIKLAPFIAEQLDADEVVEINELNVSVAVTDALTTGALSKPQGTFNKDKSRISWKYNQSLKLTSTSEEKLVARFLTTTQAKESSQGVVLKFSINNENGGKFITSNVELESQNFTEDDPFAQETWKPVPSAKTLVAGSYSALA